MNKETPQQFFEEVCSDTSIAQRNLSAVLVTHMLPDREYFLEGLSRVVDPLIIVPKPKSIHEPTLRKAQEKYPIWHLTREDFSNRQNIEEYLRQIGREVVILDMGGYFAQSINHLVGVLDPIVGVVEDTENGHQKYARNMPLNCPVYSVARSPLKEPEDYLVGQSVVFSTESVLRSNNVVFNNKNVGVLGYGKIGASISQTLASRNMRTAIYDVQPLKRIQAISHGFTSPDKRELLSEIDVLFCASGDKSLVSSDFTHLKKGCYVASVTSSDDELDLNGIDKEYERIQINEFIELFRNESHFFHLLNKGNAINFIHNAVVGDFIYLVQAELIACVDSIVNSTGASGSIESLDTSTRNKLASKWLKAFSGSKG